MKFLLLTTLRKDLVKIWVCQETSPVGSILPPIDLAMIASAVRERGHEARIFDLRLQKDPLDAYKRELASFRPDAVIINITTPSAPSDYKLLSLTPAEVKRICFGTHANALPQECFDNGADIILYGDPEGGMMNLLEHEMDGEVSEGVLTSSHSQKPPLFLDDLDSLPFPALDLLDLGEYRAPYMRERPFTVLLGSRGCPFSCIYCLYPKMFGPKARLRSVKNIVDEMAYSRERFEIKEFYFLDATFNISEKRVLELCDEILSRGLKVSWACNMRVSPASREMLEAMRKAGCRRVFYGVEDQDLLEEIKKGVKAGQTVEAFQRAREAGISTVAFIMLFPREDITEGEYEGRVLALLRRLGADAFQCTVAIPFPGTAFHDQLQERLRPGWEDYDPSGRRLPYTSSIDLIKIKRNIYLKFFSTNPKAALALLTTMGPRDLLSMGRSFFRLWRAG